LIITAYHGISPELTVKGFKKCCITSATDKTGRDVLWNGSSEEDGNVGIECKEDEGTDCEDGQSDTVW
jgi:hypothetical protein